jgi:hypothetical protein
VADWALWTRLRPGDRLQAGLGGVTAGSSPLVGRRLGALVRRPSPWLWCLALRGLGGKRNRRRASSSGFPTA